MQTTFDFTQNPGKSSHKLYQKHYICSLPFSLAKPYLPAPLSLVSNTIIIQSCIVEKPLSDEIMRRYAIHVLSSLDFNQENSGEDTPCIASNLHTVGYYASSQSGMETDKSVKKHLKLLDGLAILLVKDSATQVIATAWRITPGKCEFRYASDANKANQEETSYIQDLLNMLNGGQQWNYNIVLAQILSYRRRKFNARCKKFANSTGQRSGRANFLSLNPISHAYTSLQIELRKAGILGLRKPWSNTWIWSSTTRP